jgi:hypothetical protein
MLVASLLGGPPVHLFLSPVLLPFCVVSVYHAHNSHHVSSSFHRLSTRIFIWFLSTRWKPSSCSYPHSRQSSRTHSTPLGWNIWPFWWWEGCPSHFSHHSNVAVDHLVDFCSCVCLLFCNSGCHQCDCYSMVIMRPNFHMPYCPVSRHLRFDWEPICLPHHHLQWQRQTEESPLPLVSLLNVTVCLDNTLLTLSSSSMFTSMLCLLLCTNYHVHFGWPTTFNICGSNTIFSFRKWSPGLSFLI